MKKCIVLILFILMMCVPCMAVSESLDVTLLIDPPLEDADRVAYAERCSTDYGYQDIINNIGSEDMRRLYEAIDQAALAFWMSSADLPEDNLAYAEIDITSLSLDEDQLVQVVQVYIMDHPLFYWMSNSVFITQSDSKTVLSLWCYADYASGERREREYARIVSGIAEYAEYCEGASKHYTYATAVLYLMAQKIDYAYNASNEPEESPWAHSIIGVFNSAYAAAVCEGYAKAYQLLMNYFGVPSVYVVGYADGNTGEEGDWLLHAWNLVQMDDGQWYWTDPTWGDMDMRISYGFSVTEIENINKLEDMYFRVRYSYHLKGDAFRETHGELLNINTGYSYLYQLPTSSSEAYEPDIEGVPAIEQPIIGNKNGYQVNWYREYGAEYYTQGPIEYLVIQNDGIHRRVAAAFGNEVARQMDTIEIPSVVTLDGVEYDVVCVNLNAIEANVKSVMIPQGVKWIVGDLGYETMETESIYFPASVEFIVNPFLSQTTLSEINVSADNPYIKSVDGVLYNKDGSVLIRYPVDKGGESFTVPSGVTELYWNSFRWNKNLRAIEFGDTLTNIQANSFGETQSLEVLDIPSSVMSLAGTILIENYSIKTIRIGAGTCFEWTTLQNAKGLEVIEIEEGNACGYVYDGALYVGSQLVYYPSAREAETITVHPECTSIADFAFTGCKNVGTVKIPENCQVYLAAFFDAGVQALDIAEGNPHINYANGAIYSLDGKTLQTYLAGCRNTEFTIPNTVTLIEGQAFYNNKYIKKIEMSDSVNDVRAYAFKGCTALESIRLSDQIAWSCDVVSDFEFYRGIFEGATSLKTVNIPAAATHLPYYTFENCSSLESIVMPATLKTIGDAALWGCSNLKSVYIYNPELMPNATTDWTRAVLHTYFGDYTGRVLYIYADRDSNVADFLLDQTRNELLPGVFRDLSIDPQTLPSSGPCGDGLSWSVSADGKTLTISGTGTMTDYTMWGTEPEWHWRWSSSVEYIVIEEGVAYIGDYAFYGFEKVVDVSLPDSLITIGHHAFRLCTSLQSVTFGPNVQHIGNDTFADCTALSEITFQGGAPWYIDEGYPYFTTSAFQGVTATVHYSVYKWERFFAIYEERCEFYKAHLTWVPLVCDQCIWGPGIITRMQTCTEEGTITCTCIACGAPKEISIPLHVWNGGVVVIAQTCDAEGERLYTCMDCGTTKSESIAPHTWVNGAITLVPTDDNAGEVTYVCQQCDEIKIVSIIPGIVGDTNENFLVDILDIIDLMEWYCGGVIELNLANGEVNGDGIIDMLDIITLMEWYCGAEVTLCGYAEEVVE